MGASRVVMRKRVALLRAERKIPKNSPRLRATSDRRSSSGRRTLRKMLGALLSTCFLALAMMHVLLGGRRSSASWLQCRASTGVHCSAIAPGHLAGRRALFAAAAVVAGTIGWIEAPVPAILFARWTFAISLAFLLRAVGDFRYVGFFKSVGTAGLAIGIRCSTHRSALASPSELPRREGRGDRGPFCLRRRHAFFITKARVTRD